MKRFLLGLLVLSVLVLVPVRPAAAATIQPGDFVGSSVGGCTLGFVADDGVRTFFMTAAHCVDRLGEIVQLDDGSSLGAVVAMGDADTVESDWSLIEVTERRAEVSGVVRGHAAPSGVAGSGAMAFGDVVDFSGHGIPFFITDVTRERRFGVLTGHDARVWESIGPDTFGDSGGPVLHRSSGGAVGLVSRLCLGLCTSMGPTVEGILPQAAAKGFNLTLRTS